MFGRSVNYWLAFCCKFILLLWRSSSKTWKINVSCGWIGAVAKLLVYIPWVVQDWSQSPLQKYRISFSDECWTIKVVTHVHSQREPRGHVARASASGCRMAPRWCARAACAAALELLEAPSAELTPDDFLTLVPLSFWNSSINHSGQNDVRITSRANSLGWWYLNYFNRSGCET